MSNYSALINAIFIATILCMALWSSHKPKAYNRNTPAQPTIDAALAAAEAAEEAAQAASDAAKTVTNATKIDAADAAAHAAKATDNISHTTLQKLKLSPDTEVHAIGVYEAENPNKIVWWQKCGQLSDIECHRKYAGQHDEETIEVNVNYSKKPIVLVLSAYEPINWKINILQGRIESVILTGYYGQRITGINSNISVYAYTYKSSYCQCFQGSDPFYTYKSDDMQFYKKIFQLTGKNISSFQGKYSGKSFYIGNMD